MGQSAVAEVAQWGYKHPGIWSYRQIHAELPHLGKSTVNHSINVLCSVEPGVFQRIQQGIVHIKPPEYIPATGSTAPELRIHPPLPEPPPEEPTLLDDGPVFREILPDDADLYPPFKVQIYDHYRSRKGDRWYRFRDELGRRGVFTWNDEDD